MPTNSTLPPSVYERLKKNIRGEVFTDISSRGRYATDASIYQQFPIAVVVPEDHADIEATLSIARENGIPILPRGGGTSQCGQTTGVALVIDNSKSFRKLLSIDPIKGIAEVEPGMVLDNLNTVLKPHGLWFPVDVSTSAQATIGGMAGNNSCGSLPREIMPISMIPIKIIVTVTGLSIERSGSFRAPVP